MQTLPIANKLRFSDCCMKLVFLLFVFIFVGLFAARPLPPFRSTKYPLFFMRIFGLRGICSFVFTTKLFHCLLPVQVIFQMNLTQIGDVHSFCDEGSKKYSSSDILRRGSHAIAGLCRSCERPDFPTWNLNPRTLNFIHGKYFWDSVPHHHVG